MSFLESIKLQQHALKKTDTVVKSSDGKVFIESRENCLQFVGHHHGFIVDEKPDDVPAEVIEHLYLGSQDCCVLEVLTFYDIKYVLSVGIQPPVKFPEIQYKFLDCLDLPETDLKAVLKECVPYIDQALTQNCNILVHCNAGVSRSSSIVIGYLIVNRHNTYLQAYNIVRNARQCIKPNSGFQKQLKCL